MNLEGIKVKSIVFYMPLLCSESLSLFLPNILFSLAENAFFSLLVLLIIRKECSFAKGTHLIPSTAGAVLLYLL